MGRKRTGHASPRPATAKLNFRMDRMPRHAASPISAGRGSSRKARVRFPRFMFGPRDNPKTKAGDRPQTNEAPRPQATEVSRPQTTEVPKPQTNQGVPHISLVFREMWETQLPPHSSFPSSVLH